MKGLVFGFILAATVGPMWVLCFRRTMASGAAAGLASGMGIAVADGFYGAVAAFGLTAISGFLLAHSFWLGLVGAVFLVYLGIRTLLAKPDIRVHEERTLNLPAAFLSTLGLTLTNPPTILAFAAIFAGLGLASTTDYEAAAWIVLGVFLGSAAWWVLLTTVIGVFRERITPRVMLWVNRVSGTVLVGFGIVALVVGLGAVPAPGP